MTMGHAVGSAGTLCYGLTYESKVNEEVMGMLNLDGFDLDFRLDSGYSVILTEETNDHWQPCNTVSICLLMLSEVKRTPGPF